MGDAGRSQSSSRLRPCRHPAKVCARVCRRMEVIFKFTVYVWGHIEPDDVLIQQRLTEHLLHPRHWPGRGGYKSEQNRRPHCSHLVYILVG